MVGQDCSPREAPLSTCEAEIIALSEATKDVVYLRKLVSGLGHAEPGPSTLRTDSQSARDVSYNPQHMTGRTYTRSL